MISVSAAADPQQQLADPGHRQVGRAGIADQQHADRAPSAARSSIWPAASTGTRTSRRPDARAGPRPGSRGSRMTRAGKHRRARRCAASAASMNRIGGDQQLVGDRIEEAAELRLLLPGARQVAVEPVGDAGDRRTARSRSRGRRGGAGRRSRSTSGIATIRDRVSRLGRVVAWASGPPWPRMLSAPGI